MNKNQTTRMSLLLGLTFVFILAASVAIFAGIRPHAKSGRSMNPDRMLAHLDTDGDGLISLQEFTNPPDLFDRLDMNEDGSITREEAEQARQQHQAEMAELAAERFKEADKDQNGFLSPDEFPGPDHAFTRLDTNSDGQLSPEEMAAGRPGVPGRRMERGQRGPGFGGGFGPGAGMDREEIFRRLDQDGDGYLSADELANARTKMRERRGERTRRFDPEERFKELDTNGDGVLSAEEFTRNNRRFHELDTDQDGVVSLEEFMQGGPGRRGGHHRGY
jgi:Ca2+-binding EF-hand superfamily protein